MSSGGQRVLVVDDEFALLESLAEILAWQGFEVLTAHNGALGLELFLSAQPDVMVVDLMMPLMNGAELCNRVRATPGGDAFAIVLITSAPLSFAARASEEANGKAQGILWDAQVQKPFDWVALAEGIATARARRAGVTRD